jgi:hypothetical protein
MPAATAGTDQRPRAHQAMLGRQDPDRVLAFGAVDIEHVEQVPGCQADVGLGVAGPPGQDPGPVGGGVLDPMRCEGAEGVLANLAAAWIPTRAGRSCRRARPVSVAANRLQIAPVGERRVQR